MRFFSITKFSMMLVLAAPAAASAAGYVSVRDASAVLYDAPSYRAKKLYVVNRHMPFRHVKTLNSWVKVRDRSGAEYWIEKRVLSNERYAYALQPLVDVHAAPDAASARVFQVRQQVAMQIVEDAASGWFKVQHLDGSKGYVRRSDVWGG